MITSKKENTFAEKTICLLVKAYRNSCLSLFRNCAQNTTMAYPKTLQYLCLRNTGRPVYALILHIEVQLVK